MTAVVVFTVPLDPASIASVKELHPDDAELHALLDAGSTEVGAYLEGLARPDTITLRQAMYAAADVETVRRYIDNMLLTERYLDDWRMRFQVRFGFLEV